MIIKQENDGNFYDIEIEDNAHQFHYLVTIRNDDDGCLLSYENDDGAVYTLLHIDKDGKILVETPKLDE